MANTKISALPSGNPAQAGDIIPIDRAGANFGITAGSVGTLFSGIGSAVILADDMVGADWGAKVQAADTQLGVTAGEIWITQAAGTSAPAANITLNNGHVLRFLQGGTWALGAHSIIIPAGVLGAAIIGSGGIETTGLTYTGTGFAIVVGAAGATLTEGVTLQDLFIQCQSASDNAGCVQLLVTLFVNLVRCSLACNTAHAQYGVLSDGTGNFSSYTTLQFCTINLAKFAVKFTGSSNANILIGGSATGNLSVVAGSIGVDIDNGDSCNLMNFDIESYAIGLRLNSSHTLVNALRSEANTTDVNFTASATSNKVFTIDASGTLTVVNSGGATNQILYSDQALALAIADINTSGQVTATHLAAALPVNQGGTSQTQAGQYGLMIARSAVNVLQSTQAEAVVFTATIPAGFLTANGVVDIALAVRNLTVTGSNTYRIRVGAHGSGLTGAIIASTASASSNIQMTFRGTLANRGATNSQLGAFLIQSANTVDGSSQHSTASVDTTAAWDIVVTMQQTNADASGADFQSACVIVYP
jgi:hypothetical protein